MQGAEAHLAVELLDKGGEAGGVIEDEGGGGVLEIRHLWPPPSPLQAKAPDGQSGESANAGASKSKRESLRE
eukprot:1195248-Prorocentrum_minimum.AAC.2